MKGYLFSEGYLFTGFCGKALRPKMTKIASRGSCLKFQEKTEKLHSSQENEEEG